MRVLGPICFAFPPNTASHKTSLCSGQLERSVFGSSSFFFSSSSSSSSSSSLPSSSSTPTPCPALTSGESEKQDKRAVAQKFQFAWYQLYAWVQKLTVVPIQAQVRVTVGEEKGMIKWVASPKLNEVEFETGAKCVAYKLVKFHTVKPGMCIFCEKKSGGPVWTCQMSCLARARVHFAIQ